MRSFYSCARFAHIFLGSGVKPQNDKKRKNIRHTTKKMPRWGIFTTHDVPFLDGNRCVEYVLYQ